MSFTVDLAIFGIIPLAQVLFGLLPLRRAICATYVAGWLFLPVVSKAVIGLPDFDKVLATNLAVILGCLIYGRDSLYEVRLKWYDLPILLWCVMPGISSLANGLGPYDAFSESLRVVIAWLIPYAIGRTYFRDREGLYELGLATVVGGLCYAPLCLFEIRMSPQLNELVYGFRQNQVWRNMRFGGYRPVVFMQSGLMVGVWMGSATAVAYWFWRTRIKTNLCGISMVLIFAFLFVVTVLVKAVYAVMLLFLILGLLFLWEHLRTAIPIFLLALAIPGYMIARTGDVLPAEELVGVANSVFGAERSQSLEARLQQEDAFTQHAMERPWFGWAGWNRSWPVDEYLGEFAIRGVDGMWITEFGKKGIWGLILLNLVLLLPVVVAFWRTSGKNWARLEFVFAIMLLAFACDSLLNNMFNPVFMVAAGSLVGTAVERRTSVRESAALPMMPSGRQSLHAPLPSLSPGHPPRQGNAATG